MLRSDNGELPRHDGQISVNIESPAIGPASTSPEKNSPDVTTEIRAIRLQISDLTNGEPEESRPQTVNSNSSNIPNNLAYPRPGIIGKATAALNRLRHPGNDDSAHTLARVILPALSTELIALVPGAADIVINNPLLNQVTSITNPIAAGSYAVMLLGLGKFVLEHIAEAKQRHTYGNLLTVNRVAFSPTSDVGRTFPEIPNLFYGELHFPGKTIISPRLMKEQAELFRQPPVVVIRQGLRDLLALAHACQANSPELDGIDVFIGPHSSMVTSSYAEFGFDVRTPVSDDRLADRIFRPITRFINKVTYRSQGVSAPNRQSLACLITRQELINQIPKLEQYTRH